MDARELQNHWKRRGPNGNRYVTKIRVPLSDDGPVRWIRTKQFRAVDGKMTGERSCEIWGEWPNGEPEVLWRGELVGDLGYMVTEFQVEVGLGE